MTRLATSFAVFALLGTMTAVAPAIAAPKVIVDCESPSFKFTPACPVNPTPGKPLHPNTPPVVVPQDNNNNNNNNFGNNDNNRRDRNRNRDNNQGDGNNFQGGNNFGNNNFQGGNGFQGNDNRDRFRDGNGPRFRDFHDFRRNFRFPHFARPDFDIRLGFRVPSFFDLLPLPPEFFFFYPKYRGYLYFETPDGRIVIVSRRTHRIVAII